LDEAKWLTATKPRPGLAHLRRLHRRLDRPICTRKLLFFTLNCCRLAWPIIVDERSRQAIEIAEQHLIGLATDEALSSAKQAAKDSCDEAYAREENRPEGSFSRDQYSESLGAAIAARALLLGYTENVVGKVRDGLVFAGVFQSRGEVDSLLAEMTHALRDIFGNPFRPVPFDPAWLTSDVLLLARGIYEERAFDRMPILADALQDAGCDNEEVLDHCRGPGPHVRGCWVVDLVLGKT
jgi:hypothetical protein